MSATQALQLEIQQQTMTVNALRRQVYANPQPSEQEELWDKLHTAEDKLSQLVSQLQEEEKASEAGVIFKTDEDASRPRTMGPETTRLDVQTQLRMERIPTGIIHLLDANKTPLLTYQVKNLNNMTKRLRFTSYVEGYSATVVDTLEIPRQKTHTVQQLPTFFPDRLKQLTELTRATLHIQVDDLDGNQETYVTHPVWLLARNSAYLMTKDPVMGTYQDLRHYLVAWVTPHAEEVMHMLRKAADHQPQRELAGYQGDADFVQAQVKAIYEALKSEGMTYINSVICFGQGYGDYMQRVRLPRESLATRSANCIDGTVLFASLLEATSINPGLVLVPGHAFLAWQTQKDGKWDYLETTMVSSHSFEQAQAAGRKLVKEYQDEESSIEKTLLRLISVAETRVAYHIMPME